MILKMLKNTVNIFRNSFRKNKVITFIILELFLISIIPIRANDINIINNEEITLNYVYDMENDLLKLSWNEKGIGDKYYVFKKGINDDEYELISNNDGFNDNIFITSFRDNIGSYFIVCKNNKINELPDNIKIFSLDGNEKDIALSYKSLRNADGLESNIVQILPNENIENIYMNNEDELKWADKDNIKNNKKKAVINNEVNIKLQKIKKEIVNAVLNDMDHDGINDKNNEKIDGLYWINNGSDTVIEYKDVKLAVTSGSTPEDSYIYIKPLKNNEIIKTPFGSANLLTGNITGYDISLNGDSESRFLKDVKISFKYDATKIPQYTNKNNVFTYYFDEDKGEWQALKRESVNNNYITSTTNHFCQFYIGTMDIQIEPPQLKGLNTDPINIYKVDPMTGIWELPEISPNNMGSVEFAYKFEIPEGINGLTPGIGLSYSTEMKEGNSGYGWNLKISTIEINTKNENTPYYNSSDTLMLDGKELVKTDENEYRFKVEGSFSKIEKKSDNSFIVYQTDGIILYYGIGNEYRLYNPDKSSEIFRWYISKIEDKFGNHIDYIYESSTEKIDGKLKIVNKQLKQIDYAFISGNPRYKAIMTWQSRTDKRDNYIMGFKTVSDKILSKIDIMYEEENSPLKTYDLEYISGAFNKSLLSDIKEIIDGKVKNHQSFEYDTTVEYDKVFKYQAEWEEINVEYFENDKGFENFINSEDYRKIYNNKFWFNYLLNDDYFLKDHSGLYDFNSDGLRDLRVFETKYKQESMGLEENRYEFDINTEKIFEQIDKIQTNNDLAGLTYDFDSKILIDMNGDGLPDIVKILFNDDFTVEIAFNTGKDFKPFEECFRYKLKYSEKFMGINDIDGDSISDILFYYNGKFYLYKNQFAVKNTIQKITNEITSVSIDISYDRFYFDPYRNTSRNYLNRFALKSITTGKEGVQQYTTNFYYEFGVFDRLENEFKGFEKVKVSVQDKTKVNVFHESEIVYNINSSAGEKKFYGINDKYNEYEKSNITSVSKSLRVTGDTADNVFELEKIEYEYEEINVFGTTVEFKKEDVKLVYPVKKIIWIYDYEGNFIGLNEEQGDIITESSLNIDMSRGLITSSRTIEYGDPYNINDDIIKTVSYAVNTENNKWLCLPFIQNSADINNQPISRKILYYDGLSKGAVMKGILTSEKICDVKIEDETDFAHMTTTFGYDTFGNVNYIKDPTDIETALITTYNDENHTTVVRKTWMDLTEIACFDRYGRLMESEDIYDDVSIYNYDFMGRVVSIKETINGALVQTKEFMYEKTDTHFKVNATFLDPENTDNKIALVFFKDVIGREVQTKAERVVDGDNKNIVSGKIEFDAMGRVHKTGPVSTASTTDTYYEEKIITDTDPLTTINYDKSGRIEETILPSGLKIENRYSKQKYTDSDSDGNTIVRILDVTATASYDGAIKKNEIIKYKDMNGIIVKTETWNGYADYTVIEMEYDLFGYSKVIEKEGAFVKISEKKIDSLGRLLWMRSPEGVKSEYRYNDKGLVIKETDYGINESDNNKIEINYIYDAKNRIIEINYTDDDGSNTVTYDYYPETDINTYRRGCVKTISKGTYYSVTYEYGQLWIEDTKTINESAYTTKYEYDVQGRIKKLTYPDGEIITYLYDEGGFLKRIEGVKNNVIIVYIDEIKYNKEGQKLYIKYGNGTEMIYSYNDTTLMLDNYLVKKDTKELLNYTYNYDIVGNIKTITDAPNSITKSVQNFTYDERSRLIDATGCYNFNTNKNYSRNFTYSADNRILEKTFGDQNAIYTFNYKNNHNYVSSVHIQKGSDSGIINFNYDDFGNITARIYKGLNELESQQYIYDITNKLRSVSYNGTTTDFLYDNNGQRIMKTYEDSVNVISNTTYISDFYTDRDGVVVKNVSDGKYIVASKILNDSSSIKYYHQNYIGSTALLTDDIGEKFQSYLYMPYDEIWVIENGLNAITDKNGDGIADDLNHLFTGQQYDKETGLYYYNARYYDPHLCMFIKLDPTMNELNHYMYANCNPMIHNCTNRMLSIKSAGCGAMNGTGKIVNLGPSNMSGSEKYQ